jgi:hypothetical protein
MPDKTRAGELMLAPVSEAKKPGVAASLLSKVEFAVSIGVVGSTPLKTTPITLPVEFAP